METAQTNLDLHLWRISIERRLLMMDHAKYRHRTRNANNEDHGQTITNALAHVKIQIQSIDSSILNIHNRVSTIKPSIYCDKKSVKKLEAEVKQLLWE